MSICQSARNIRQSNKVRATNWEDIFVILAKIRKLDSAKFRQGYGNMGSLLLVVGTGYEHLIPLSIQIPPDPAIFLQGRDVKEFSHRSSGAMCDYAQGDGVYGVYSDRIGKHLGAPHWELWKSRVWNMHSRAIRQYLKVQVAIWKDLKYLVLC